MYFKKFIYYQQVALSRSKPPYGNCSEGESFYQTYGVRYTMSVGFFPQFLFIPLECSFHLKMSKYLDLCHLLDDTQREITYIFIYLFFSRHAFIFAEISMSQRYVNAYPRKIQWTSTIWTSFIRFLFVLSVNY